MYVNVLLNTSLRLVLAEISRLSELPKLPSKILLGPKTMQQQYQPMFLAPLEAQGTEVLSEHHVETNCHCFIGIIGQAKRG